MSAADGESDVSCLDRYRSETPGVLIGSSLGGSGW